MEMDGLESDNEFFLEEPDFEKALENSGSDTSPKSFLDSSSTSSNPSNSGSTWCSWILEYQLHPYFYLLQI